MNKRAVVVLGLVTAALAAYVVLYERTSLTSKELAERKDKVLTSFVRAKVERLEIQRRGKTVVIEREPPSEGDQFGGWTMLAPAKESADDDAVDAVLGELEWLSARRTLEALSADDIVSFGLDKPRYRVRYQAGDESHVLSLGKPDVHGEGVYARVDDEPVAFVVPKTLLETLDHDPLHYRNKEFLGQMTTAWARRLELITATSKVEVLKDKGRFWSVGTLQTYADARKVEPILRALDDLRAARFLEPDAAPAAVSDLQKPVRTVRLSIVPDEGREDRAASLVELQIGGPCAGHEGELYARSGAKGTPVCIQAEDAKPFEASDGDVRLASPFAADSSTIERVELSAGKDKLILSRDGEKWKTLTAEVDREAVEQWLADLSAQKAVQFLPAGAFTAATTVTLMLASDTKESFSLGQVRPDGSVLVQREGEGALVAFPRELADLLAPAPRRFTTLSPWSELKPSDVTAIEARDGTTRRSLTLAEGNWRVEGAPLSSDDVRMVVRGLTNLRAHAFVAEAPRAEHALAAPAAELTLSLADGKKRGLVLGATIERGQYARIDDGPVVLVPHDLIAQVKALAGTAPLPTPPPEDDEEEGEELHGHAH